METKKATVPIANIRLNGEKLNAFPLVQGTREDIYSHYCCSTELEVLPSAVRKLRN